MLSTRPDWEKSRQRFEAWWCGEIVDRPLLQVFAPRHDLAQEPPKYSSLEERWLDADYRIRLFEWQMARTYYAGDAFPYMGTEIGPGTLSLYLGAEAGFGADTVWYEPCISDMSLALPPRLNKNNRYYQASTELLREGVERLKGRALVTFPDLVENLDTIASLVGSEELARALIDCPEKVHEFQRSIVRSYVDCYDDMYEVIKDDSGGSCFTTFSVYGAGRVSKLQCDFSAMISPGMFEEFVVPYLAEQCRHLDSAVYHWDGVGALQHESLILSIDGLKAVQWTPGAGKASVADEVWWPMYRRVREAGKSLLLLALTPAEAEAVIRGLGPEGLNIVVWADSPETADDLVRRSSTW